MRELPWIGALIIAVVLAIVILLESTKERNRLKPIHLPNPNEWHLVRAGDTLTLRETDTSVEVGFYHSFREPQCGERLVIYKED